MVKRKKPKRTTQRNKADRLFSQMIRARDGHRCVIPGCMTAFDVPQCAHLVSRRYYAVRHDPSNAVCLCRVHHMMYTHNPVAWDLWVEGRLGVDAWRELKTRALSLEKVDYEDVIAKLEEGLRLQAELQDP